MDIVKYFLLLSVAIIPLKQLGFAKDSDFNFIVTEDKNEDDHSCKLYRSSNIDEIATWPEDVFLAAFINTECENCFESNSEEKKALIFILIKRAKDNFDGFGNCLIEQLAAKKQFAAITSRKIHTKFYFDPNEEHHLDNLMAARAILNGYKPSYIPDDSYYFMLPSAAPVTPKRLKKSNKTIPTFFYHLIF
jgi:hypothetical protein